MKKTVPQKPAIAVLPRYSKRMLLLGLLFLFFLATGIGIIRQSSFLLLFGFSSASPKDQDLKTAEENAIDDGDYMTVAALSEETAANKFRSGGLGLTRSNWEVLHGQPESAGGFVAIAYQDSAYKVTYQQDLVWQIEKSWKKAPLSLKEARVRVRRYLPLDSQLTEIITTSDDTIIDTYRSHMLAQLLVLQPAEPPAQKTKRRQKELPTELCVVVHRLEKQKVTSTLLHIGPPKPKDYSPPQSQTVPVETITSKDPTQSEAHKTASPTGKSKIQGKS